MTRSWVTFPPIITVRGTTSLLGSSLIPEQKAVLVGVLASAALRSCDLTVVERDGVQTGEQLPLVLVDSLHLDVEHGVGIDDQVVVVVQVRRELYFVLLRATGAVREGWRVSPRGRTDTFLIRATSRTNTSLSANLRMFFS